MLPVIALVGRPNVGKSTLFNQLTHSRDALVANLPGLTRDRQYGRGKVGPAPYVVVDTGGLGYDDQALDELMAQQTRVAVDEADVILFLVDARDGLTGSDERIAEQLRRQGKSVYLVVNKIDGADADTVTAEFFSLGLGPPQPISAAQGRGVAQLIGHVFEACFPGSVPTEQPREDERETAGIRVAVIGRPNVGKSTLINRLLGEERVVTFDLPGTTRDSIYIPFQRGEQRYTLIDTAGVRRRSRVHEAVEKFSVIKAMQAIEEAHVVIMVVNAREGIVEQDATILGHVLETGRALVLAVNKWDGLSKYERDEVRRELDRKLSFLDFAEIHFVSALHGTGVGHLFEASERAYESATRTLATPELSRILEDAVSAHAPPVVRGRRIRLRYAHQGGRNPPVIVVHGKQVDSVPDAYRRYLVNTFRKRLHLSGTPLRVELRSGENPYAERGPKPASRARRGRIKRSR